MPYLVGILMFTVLALLVAGLIVFGRNTPSGTWNGIMKRKGTSKRQ
jgi:hypothetical protein